MRSCRLWITFVSKLLPILASMSTPSAAILFICARAGDVDGLRVFLRSHRELLDELERILASPAPKGRRTRRAK
jgi:hypothetical protein